MKYGLIGEHLGHSFSAPIHEQLTGEPYELAEIAPEDLEAFMRRKDFRAINVTIPYKQAVIPYLDEISETARAIGAVNTIVNRNGRLCGDNTDCDGIIRLIRRVCPDPAGKKALVLGTGGTSRTADYALRLMGAEPGVENVVDVRHLQQLFHSIVHRILVVGEGFRLAEGVQRAEAVLLMPRASAGLGNDSPVWVPADR